MKIALLQMTSGIDPDVNAATLETAIADAAGQGAAMLFTPEMSGLLDSNGARAATQVTDEVHDRVLARVRAAAAREGVWVHLGSLAVEGDEGDPRWANRAFVIDADGEIAARYDKVHLFDVDLPTGESWRESSRYVPGQDTALVNTPVGKLGLSICYDMRFPALFQALSGAGATILSVPAAFTVPTGQAHWHTLLRARAIENACWLVAAAQTGTHEDGRSTYGHSLVVDPWGKVVLDMETTAGLAVCEIDPAAVDDVRSRVPVIAHRRAIPVPA
ncbi:carbon-nitrogen hydrolase family protein [Sphingomonas sp. SUN039]|uniref:carbon-nitrogen hydrolase family protein n=1 Tax=Sphingomonas sp. SUN039 TaxID=2937787 RepID=UPI0021648374|nr:carbon-nitrogen hydrolase family protein [Sphingomonas sp. SUN039]UVO53464.1 carbon-nitrogen hydrolase family protein [Sphingomonas sp. SUN039]